MMISQITGLSETQIKELNLKKTTPNEFKKSNTNIIAMDDFSL